jgi:cob(I)alamin adenosyltransferase
MIRTRLPRRFVEHLTGSQAWTDAADPEHELFARIRAARVLADGARSVELSTDERAALLDYAEAAAIGASQGIEPGDTEALADLNAARAAVRRLS